MRTNGTFTTVNLTVLPVASSAERAVLADRFLVILEEAVPGAPSSPAPLTADAPDTSAPEADQRIAALEEELRAK
ncbi:MAG: hypothetical protein HGA45_40380, partial [Chloroflexales bacterium]|nr:hypothetical protein [Chloroflexales bacterium]